VYKSLPSPCNGRNKSPASSRKRLGCSCSLSSHTCDRASVSQSCRIASVRVRVSERLYYHLYLPLCLEAIAPRSHLLACSQQDRLGIGRFATLPFNTLSLCLVDVQHTNSEEWLKISPKLSKPISSGWSSITSWGSGGEPPGRYHRKIPVVPRLCFSSGLGNRRSSLSRLADCTYAFRGSCRLFLCEKKLQRLESDTSECT
jgi:hypothetical protein